MKPATVACVVGARPNFVKIAPIIEQLAARPGFSPVLVHTGQHYSPEMSGNLFGDLNLRDPDVNLGVSSGTASEQVAEMMAGLEQLFTENRPKAVLVVGDVNSTLAATLVASKMWIPVVHVEAGLRSFDRSMPEEINRLVTDALSDYLMVSEPSGVSNLLSEGVPEERIFFVGNVMIDTLLRCRQKASETGVLERLGVQPKQYAIATLHRPSNVDHAERLAALTTMLEELARELPVVFPVHPRTRQRMEAAGITARNLILTPPLGYLEFLRLMDQARLVLTDSGGIQEETTILQVPCLTLRENTERPVTIEQGTNRLVGVDPRAALRAAREVLSMPPRPMNTPELWDGRTSKRIVDVLERVLLS